MRKIVNAFGAGLGAALAIAGAASGQSLRVQDPTPLAPGQNRGTVDSFVGSQYWAFTALPGHFHVTFTGGSPQEGFTIGGRAGVGMAFAPRSPTSHFTTRETAQGTEFDGVVAQPQKVYIEVDPRKSPLVRQTTDYVLTLSGDVDGSGAERRAAAENSGQQIVGVYMCKVNDFGAVRFAPDGQITASNGAHGHWTLFDPASHIYSVELGGTRLTLTLSPGRGLIETSSRNLWFELQR